MSIARQVDERLSITRKRVIYLVSEDRHILRDILSHLTRVREMTPEYKGDDQGYYPRMREKKRLVDAYQHFSMYDKFPKIPADRLGKVNDLEPYVYVLEDFHILDDSFAAHFLKQFLAATQSKPYTILFLISPIVKIPLGFESEVELIDVEGIGETEIEALLMRYAQKRILRINGDALTESEKYRIRSIVPEMKGLKKEEITMLLDDLDSGEGSFYGHDSMSPSRIEHIARVRKQMVKQYKEIAARNDDAVTLIDVENVHAAGLDGYRNWLMREKESFLRQREVGLEWGVSPPKGVLLSGVPGTGKTLMAKVTAQVLGVTLVQFRMDGIFGKALGATESNFRRCIKMIESLAPCVMLIDEIEKVFKIDSDSHEVRRGIFASLLSWMQENRKPVFVFATANSVSDVPPELLRDGRFDMRFYVYMPMHDEVISILTSHLERVNQETEGKLFSTGLQRQIKDRSLAKAFLQSITAYAIQEDLHMFYTGANLENLVKKTQSEMKSRAQKNEISRPYPAGYYLETLIECARHPASRPYGETNRSDIARFWLAAREHKYVNAAIGTGAGAPHLALFDFYDFDEEKARFTCDGRALLNDYDRHMFKKLSAAICERQAKINEDDDLRRRAAEEAKRAAEKASRNDQKR